MKKIINLLLICGFVLAVASVNINPFFASVYNRIEEFALFLVPDEIEEFISALNEKLT